MTNKPKYDSSRDRTNYTFHPGRRFHLQWDAEPGGCSLFALDERQAATLRKMVQVFPKYHWVWGLESPRRDWDAATWQLWDDISTFVDELEACLVSGCDLNEWLKQQRMLTAAIVGEAVDLTDPAQLSPDAVDFTENGLVPSLMAALHADNFIYGDLNVTEVLLEGLVGRRAGITLPFQGEGIADIADEHLTQANLELQTLHNRFRMTDSSLFNPLGEKNIVEALETQLRVDKATDLEFLTPNIATVMNQVMKLENDSPLRVLFDQIYEWVTGNPAPPVPDYNTVAELLLLIAKGQQQVTVEPTPIELTTNVTTNVSCKCGGSGCGGCGGGTTTTEGEEGGEPPIGWDPPEEETGTEIVPGTPLYQNRKCKLANIVHENLVAMFIKLRDNEVLSYVAEQWGSSYLQIMTTMLSAIIGELATPIPILDGLIGAVVGYILGSLLELLIGELDINEIVDTISDPALQDDLVCAFYSSTSVWEARGNYVTVLQNNGMQLNNAAFVEGFLIAELLNIFFFTKSELAVEIEAKLPDYVGPVDCSVCGGCESVLVDVGTITNLTANSITIQSVSTGSLHEIGVYWNVEETTPGQFAYCGSPGADVTDITSTNNLVGGIVQDNPNNTTIDDFHLYPPNSNLPVFPYQNVGRIIFTFNSGETGSVTITFNQP